MDTSQVHSMAFRMRSNLYSKLAIRIHLCDTALKWHNHQIPVDSVHAWQSVHRSNAGTGCFSEAVPHQYYVPAMPQICGHGQCWPSSHSPDFHFQYVRIIHCYTEWNNREYAHVFHADHSWFQYPEYRLHHTAHSFSPQYCLPLHSPDRLWKPSECGCASHIGKSLRHYTARDRRNWNEYADPSYS